MYSKDFSWGLHLNCTSRNSWGFDHLNWGYHGSKFNISAWWFGTFFIFPYILNNHPNWLSYFSEGLVYHQPEWFSGKSDQPVLDSPRSWWNSCARSLRNVGKCLSACVCVRMFYDVLCFFHPNIGGLTMGISQRNRLDECERGLHQEKIGMLI